MNDGHPADGKEKRFSSLLKLFGRGKRDEDVTEEIMDMVNESHEQGVLEENEAEMIGNIFEFGEKQASDVMTHRNNIVALDDDITVREAFDKIMKENYQDILCMMEILIILQVFYISGIFLKYMLIRIIRIGSLEM